MSDNRKILVAKRKNERRNPHVAERTTQVQEDRRGIKRPNDKPKKNLANERLKRLRTSLNEEVRNSGKSVSNSFVNRNENFARKRPPNSTEASVCTKVLKQNEDINTRKISQSASSFIFKEEFITQKSTFTTTTENPFSFDNFQQQSVNNTEDMDWTPTDEKSTTDTSILSGSSLLCDSVPNHHFYIVVDTNVFLSQMQTITNIIAMNVKGPREPIVFIPWIVIEELDFIKSDSNKSSLRHKAQKAVKFIDKTLSNKHQRMRGQTLIEANEQISTGINQDDKIISCCMQVLQKYKNMILLTNDINLRNKANLNGIPVCSANEITSKISLALNNLKSAIILEKMTNLCNIVIRECAQKAYGEAWSKMPICQPSSKSLPECIATFTKYWFPVFQEVVMKQFRNAIDELSAFITKHTTINDGTKELKELLRLCLRVCLFLKDTKCCQNVIEKTICDLNNIKQL